MEVIDVSNPSQPELLSSVYLPGKGLGIHIRGSYAYLADGRGGLQIVNISDTNAPIIVGMYDTMMTASSLVCNFRRSANVLL